MTEKQQLGYVKKFIESISVPVFRRYWSDNPHGFLDFMRVPLGVEEVSFVENYGCISALHRNSAMDKFLKFSEIYNKITIMMYNRIIPTNPKLKKWRESQILRCRNENLEERMHIPLAFELSLGCSVGCSFCGFNSSSLSEVFFASKENINLFRGVLDAAIKVIGRAAGHGILYYSTEPLDNPDYEVYADIVASRVGVLPQITTADPLRNITKMRWLMADINETQNIVYRFSVRSLEQLFLIYNSFSAEEMLFTLVEPRYPESDIELAFAGRNAAKNGFYGGTIACVSGFVVNMCKKTISLRTPTNASPSHPTGELILAETFFRNADDFCGKIQNIIKTHMT